MMKPPLDPEREERIDEEIIVDAYDAEEQAMSWYNHLDDTLAFPFSARWGSNNDIIKVTGMASGEDWSREMFVMVCYQGKTGENTVVARLRDIQPLDEVDDEVDEETVQAVEDWHYWVARGRM